jgi:hypothetical protein
MENEDFTEFRSHIAHDTHPQCCKRSERRTQPSCRHLRATQRQFAAATKKDREA